jgi:hypothetical protein
MTADGGRLRHRCESRLPLPAERGYGQRIIRGRRRRDRDAARRANVAAFKLNARRVPDVPNDRRVPPTLDRGLLRAEADPRLRGHEGFVVDDACTVSRAGLDDNRFGWQDTLMPCDAMLSWFSLLSRGVRVVATEAEVIVKAPLVVGLSLLAGT